MAGATLPERVAQIYYTYGLFCSSYPIIAITLALSVVLLCCYPLLNVPLPGNIPTVVNLPWQMGNFKNSPHANCSTKDCFRDDVDIPEQLSVLLNETQKLPYVWAKERPLLYVHQIVMKIGVSPWNNNLKMWDAFRAPLQEVFRLLETIRNHEDPETKSTLLHHCYQIEGVKRRNDEASMEQVLPEYSCLLLSPANLWQQNLQSFSLDANIVNTIFKYEKSKPIAEMTFGMQLRDTGIKRYPLRARPRVLQYAITIFYRNPEQRFIQSLSKKLREMYPLYQETYDRINELTLIFYPGQFNYRELVPLLITFIGLFLYVYFSVRKIEFIKSKFGLAASAVVTVAGSLSMSMGICFYFGFSLSLQGKEIFPYLVIIMGLENVLVLTKSVTSTDSRLDVKIRLAQGLSKEGWSITKNLLTEITIFTVGFFTFMPFVQEVSIFMIVSLLSDYFIQLVFFATILGIDVCRMECFQDQNDKLHLKGYYSPSNALNWRFSRNYLEDNDYAPRAMKKSKSHPRLNGLVQNSPTDVVAKRNASPGHQDNRVPKRIRLFNLWARTRFFQRAFMVWMLVWISMIVYNSDVLDYFIVNTEKNDTTTKDGNVKTHQKIEMKQSLFMSFNTTKNNPLVFSPLPNIVGKEKSPVDANDTIMFKHSLNSRPWSRLSPYHWSTILSQYNESVGGRFAVILPPLLLSHRVSPELAVTVQHPDEKDPPPLRWQALAAALDPIDIISDFELIENKRENHWSQGAELPIYPTTPMEILLLAILCTISVAVIAYMMVVLYRCICSRHYAEWRASWNEDDEYKRIIAKQPAVQLVMEAVPVVVAGHVQEVECLVTDGEKIVSSCLQGTIKVWDSQNGEILTNIDRCSYFQLHNELYRKVDTKKIEISDTIEEIQHENVFPQHNENMPRLRKRLNEHLSGLTFRTESRESPPQLSVAETTRYNFAKSYRILTTTSYLFFYNLNISEPSVRTAEQSDMCDNNILLNDNSEVNLLHNRNKSRLVSGSSVENRTDSVVHPEAVTNSNWRGALITESPIWCMDFCNDLIIAGCADGRIEFWEASSGKLMCIRRSGGLSCGVTHVRALSGARRVCAATLSGHITLLRLDAHNTASGTLVDWRFSTAHRRTHKRTGSAGSLRNLQGGSGDNRSRTRTELADAEEVVCVRVAQCRPHQQPITEMHSEGERILTGGQDHVLKVFSSTDLSALFTLHGHCGPVTSCFIDHATPTIAGSGSQDGLLCVWDLHTGACLYSTQAHDGAVTSLAYTASYVVSAGADERLCIWDRFQGHMLNSIHIGLNYMSRLLPLTHTLLVMGDNCGLTVYDLSSGDVIRRVLLGQSDGCIFVRQILPLKDAIVCDYANQLRIVRFPLVSRLSSTKRD
ncbi:unnamed protein product [Diatraea saccharalis]|uniref:Sterol regulatory element-binding protein cleavage-activating protein n=1 Tax=Diatraea saccharalis TaxID=40085 RepID=A0A9N9N0I9_9NEOP|nr:unnamed protein product [Diatraea saccharalis]